MAPTTMAGVKPETTCDIMRDRRDLHHPPVTTRNGQVSHIRQDTTVIICMVWPSDNHICMLWTCCGPVGDGGGGGVFGSLTAGGDIFGRGQP